MTTVEHRLGDVIRYLRGITFKPEEKVELSEADAVVCMRTKNVQHVLDESDLIAVPASLVRRDELYLRDGDILLSSANSWNLVGKVCRVPRLNYRATAGGFISVVRPRSNVDSRYLYHWLASPAVQERIRGCARQTTNISNLSVPQFEQLNILVPPLAEQHRIADILDKADAIRRKRTEAIALTEELLRSAFLEMFGDPVTNPMGWPQCKMGDLCTRITDGTHLTPKFIEKGVPFLFVRNVDEGRLTFATDKYISEETYRELTRRCPIEVGDVLYVTVGATYGDAVIVETDARFCFQRHLAHLKPDGRVTCPRFLHALLRSHAVKRQADRRVRGAAQPTLNLRELRDFDVFRPPLPLQLKFNDLTAELQALRLKQLASWDATDGLFNSLLNGAFRGELTEMTEATPQLGLFGAGGR